MSNNFIQVVFLFMIKVAIQLYLFILFQQPPKMMSCTLIKAPRLGAQPWLKDEQHYTYKKRSVYLKSKYLLMVYHGFSLNYFSILLKNLLSIYF